MTDPVVVGIIGGGQLAMMMIEAAAAIDVECRVLARPHDESVRGIGHAVVSTDIVDPHAVESFARRVDVITFDHEPVDALAISAVEAAERAGHLVFPSSAVLRFSDKEYQRRRFSELGIPVPPFVVTNDIQVVESFAAEHGWPVVLKVPRGGYDGRGVNVCVDRSEARGVLDTVGQAVVVEPMLALDAELSVVVVRDRAGNALVYPLVDTVQHDGICHQVTVPSGVSDSLAGRAREIALQVVEAVDAVGVLAVELFVVDGEVSVNEVAPRPHNSGHLTIEACETSQFENHLRAVAGLPLGSCELIAPAAAMVNLIAGGDDPVQDEQRRDDAAPPDGSAATEFVHWYHKRPRADRKVGHVTVVASTADEAAAAAHCLAGELMMANV